MGNPKCYRVFKRVPIGLIVAFAPMASVASPPDSPIQYGWRLVESVPLGEDQVDTWKYNLDGSISALHLRRAWGTSFWIDEHGNTLEWEFPGVVTNAGFAPRSIRMSSEGTTRFTFQYTPYPGQPMPSRAVFRVSATAIVASSSTMGANNGFSDPVESFEPPHFASTGKHLLERGVASDGRVIITLPIRRAEATASGHSAYVWADARSAVAGPDTRRASIVLPNYRARATGNEILTGYHSGIHGISVPFIYPEYERIPTPILDSSNTFNKALFAVGTPIKAISRAGNMTYGGPVPLVSLLASAEASVESPSDYYDWIPGFRGSASLPIQSWSFESEYQRRWDRHVTNLHPHTLVFEGFTYESEGIASMPIVFKYTWESDGATAISERILAFRSPVEEVAAQSFIDFGDVYRPAPLGSWQAAGVPKFIYRESPTKAFVVGQTAVGLAGIAAIVYSSVPGAILAAAAGIAIDVGSAWSLGQQVEIPVGMPSYVPKNNQPEPDNWRQLEGNYAGDFGPQNVPHFKWRVYYVPQADVTMTANNIYDLYGFKNQVVVQSVVGRSIQGCSKQFRFWHDSAGVPPQ